jgi:hypothetical protein
MRHLKNRRNSMDKSKFLEFGDLEDTVKFAYIASLKKAVWPKKPPQLPEDKCDEKDRDVYLVRVAI